MATTTLNGNDIPLKISTDAGVTYKSVVCATTSGIEMSRDISEKETTESGIREPEMSV